MNNQDILNSLKSLDKKFFKVRIIGNGWYTTKSLLNAFGVVDENLKDEPIIRVELLKYNGILELYPNKDLVDIKCYCCFGGNPKKGSYRLNKLKEAIISLKDHHCPPWPG